MFYLEFSLILSKMMFYSYILMSEPDHIIVKPIPNLSKDGLGAAFPFFYIEPKKYEKQLRKFFPEDMGPITNIDPIGNSPVIVGKVCNTMLLSDDIRILLTYLHSLTLSIKFC